jgi:hypothetical protein
MEVFQPAFKCLHNINNVNVMEIVLLLSLLARQLPMHLSGS